MDKMSPTDVLKLAYELSPWIIDVRRHIHSHPDLSFHEQETAAFVAHQLHAMPLEVREGIGGAGVVALLRGKNTGSTVALRADMDALPVQEMNEVPFRSQRAQSMHACGHDGHTAMLLGAARLLTSLRDDIAGNVKFIFQPAEEVPPVGGAKRMIEEGVLQNPAVDAIFAVHIWPDLPSGVVGVSPGAVMAAPDMFKLTVRGKSGHAAAPHRAVDSIVMTAQVILAFQTLVSRRVDPLKPVVLSFGRCNGGSAYNILPDEMQLEGTTRYFDPELGRFLEQQMGQMAYGICEANGGTCELVYQYGFPPTINNPDMASVVYRAAATLLGNDKAIWIDAPSMTGEDFSYFLQKVPGCYFWLGTRNPQKGMVSPLHSSTFQIDEDVLSAGAAVLARSALDFLQGKQPG